MKSITKDIPLKSMLIGGAGLVGSVFAINNLPLLNSDAKQKNIKNVLVPVAIMFLAMKFLKDKTQRNAAMIGAGIVVLRALADILKIESIQALLPVELSGDDSIEIPLDSPQGIAFLRAITPPDQAETVQGEVYGTPEDEAESLRQIEEMQRDLYGSDLADMSDDLNGDSDWMDEEEDIFAVS